MYLEKETHKRNDMQNLIPYLAFLFLLVACISQPSGEEVETQPGNFEALEEVGSWLQMWNNYDLNQVDKLFLNDSRLTYFSSEKEGIIIGIDSIHAHHQGFGFVEGGKEQPNKLWLEDMNQVTLGDTELITAIWVFESEDGTSQRGPVTIVYYLEEGDYKIAHMNFGNYPGE